MLSDGMVLAVRHQKPRIRICSDGLWRPRDDRPRAFWFFGDPKGHHLALHRYDCAWRMCREMNDLIAQADPEFAFLGRPSEWWASV